MKWTYLGSGGLLGGGRGGRRGPPVGAAALRPALRRNLVSRNRSSDVVVGLPRERLIASRLAFPI